uniref:F-box domain-containing protein n=1 Tax=Quercus lobata TaxID=97700 RepID=A0A7N2R1L8_QUELO
MSNYLPVEMIEEILVRQPAKSLRRFRSVCKTWDSVISRFATAHLARSNQRPSFIRRGCLRRHQRCGIRSSLGYTRRHL